MNEAINSKLTELKTRYAKEGFIIVGVSGSYARDEESDSSDIDLLYKIENPALFSKVYGGFGAFSKIAQIREELKAALKREVDLIAINGLGEIGKKYIMGDMRYV